MDTLSAEPKIPSEREKPPEWDGREIGDLLGLAQMSASRFRSQCAETNEHGRVYGGQILGQALSAATETVSKDRFASCLQLVFAAGGLPDQAIDFEVQTLQEGKRFSARNVRGLQGAGRILCDACVTFAKALESPAHEAPPPSDCGLDRNPEDCPALEHIDHPGVRDVERTLNYMYRPHRAIDMRAPFVEDLLPGKYAEPRMRFWIRLRQTLGDGPDLHAAAFAYLSDYWINFAACIAHVSAMAERDARLYVASLNHTIWFHRSLRSDAWLLFDCISPSGAFGRGLATARVFSRAGDLVASAAQECLLAPTA
ncbi:acyl-CoA thioesterase [Roseiarcus sp.]|uniref:acyl-CoA thioesterase n=1 Tax=Roseiarcus sp. TaxID=1969460 RepID=UPI003F96DF41